MNCLPRHRLRISLSHQSLRSLAPQTGNPLHFQSTGWPSEELYMKNYSFFMVCWIHEPTPVLGFSPPLELTQVFFLAPLDSWFISRPNEEDFPIQMGRYGEVINQWSTVHDHHRHHPMPHHPTNSRPPGLLPESAKECPRKCSLPSGRPLSYKWSIWLYIWSIYIIWITMIHN